jgi:hypothetical protein
MEKAGEFTNQYYYSDVMGHDNNAASTLLESLREYLTNSPVYRRLEL